MSNAQQHQKNKTKQQQNVKSTPRKHNIDKLTSTKTNYATKPYRLLNSFCITQSTKHKKKLHNKNKDNDESKTK